MVTGISDAHNHDVRHPFVIHQAANHRIKQFEIPLTVEQVEHGIFIVFVLIEISRLANVKIVVPPRGTGFHRPQFRTRNCDGRIRSELAQ
jgi:hypothetical protein